MWHTGNVWKFWWTFRNCWRDGLLRQPFLLQSRLAPPLLLSHLTLPLALIKLLLLQWLLQNTRFSLLLLLWLLLLRSLLLLRLLLLWLLWCVFLLLLRFLRRRLLLLWLLLRAMPWPKPTAWVQHLNLAAPTSPGGAHQPIHHTPTRPQQHTSHHTTLAELRRAHIADWSNVFADVIPRLASFAKPLSERFPNMQRLASAAAAAAAPTIERHLSKTAMVQHASIVTWPNPRKEAQSRPQPILTRRIPSYQPNHPKPILTIDAPTSHQEGRQQTRPIPPELHHLTMGTTSPKPILTRRATFHPKHIAPSINPMALPGDVLLNPPLPNCIMHALRGHC